jgi:nicotinamide mononucleotide adenylyltransferase
MDDYEEAVLFTFALLESRLDRLEYILGGAKKADAAKPMTVTERIQTIEKSLQELSAKTALLNDARELRMYLTQSGG